MKNILLFIAGMMTGVLLMTVIGILTMDSTRNSQSYPQSNSSNDEIIMFSEAEECFSKKKFKVFQVLDSGRALANELSFSSEEIEMYHGVSVLFVSEGRHFYDDEIITVPKGKCVRQIGIYKYDTYRGSGKTVPLVEINDK